LILSPGRLCAVTDADERQLALEAVGHALDHVRDQRAQRALHGARVVVGGP
jgi:hypothetical protein